MLHCQTRLVKGRNSRCYRCAVLHAHFHHIHDRSHVRQVEVLHVVARLFLGHHEVEVIVALVQGTCLGVSPHIVQSVHLCGEFGDDLHRLQELVHLQCLFSRAAVNILGEVDTINHNSILIIVAVARYKSQRRYR